MSTIYQIKKIHTLKNILGLDDDLYRDMLASFGVCSSKSLTQAEAQVLIEILQDKLSATQNIFQKKYDDFTGRDKDMATPRQLRKLEVIWDCISKSEDKKQHLRSFLKQQFHVDDLRFLTKQRASQIIAVLEKIKVQMCLKAI